MDALGYFQKGGPVMYLLLACSVAVAAIGMERFRFYRYAERGKEAFLRELLETMRSGALEQGLELCRSSFLGRVASAGIEAAIRGEDAGLALDMAYSEAAMKLRAYLGYLSMIVTLAPLLGLLGTIFGMIESFNIFHLQAGQPLAITGGIGEALVATAAGLCVAIFALLVHTYFAQRLDEALTVLERISAIVRSGAGGKDGSHA